MNFSRSENAGIEAIPTDALNILSVGISTGGIAEMRMAEINPDRHIIATTIDEVGATFASERIAEEGFSRQIDVKLEDVAQPQPYPDEHFDFIYARLVLHYLSRQELPVALDGLYRVLRPEGSLFVVVRSVDCPEADKPDNTYDRATGLTTYSVGEENNKRNCMRYFHSEKSISDYLEAARFTVKNMVSYDERLYVDFMRTTPAPHNDNVIEIIAEKRDA